MLGSVPAHSPGTRALLNVDAAAVAHWSSDWVTQIGTVQLGPARSLSGNEEGKNKEAEQLRQSQGTWKVPGYLFIF